MGVFNVKQANSPVLGDLQDSTSNLGNLRNSMEQLSRLQQTIADYSRPAAHQANGLRELIGPERRKPHRVLVDF
jgi:hypothetical protein